MNYNPTVWLTFTLSPSHSLTLALGCSLLSRGALGREVEAPLLTGSYRYWGGVLILLASLVPRRRERSRKCARTMLP